MRLPAWQRDASSQRNSGLRNRRAVAPTEENEEPVKMLEPAFTPQLDLATLGRLLHVLGSAGFLSGPADAIRSLLISAGVAAEGKDAGRQRHSQVLVATN